jgi:hypothetical protein
LVVKLSARLTDLDFIRYAKEEVITYLDIEDALPEIRDNPVGCSCSFIVLDDSLVFLTVVLCSI